MPRKKRKSSPLGPQPKKPLRSLVPIRNKYQPLRTDEDAPDAQSISAASDLTIEPTPRSHVPPIVLFNIKVMEFYKAIRALTPPIEAEYKVTQFGTKFFCVDVAHFKRLREYCLDQKHTFFSYTLPAERRSKFVIYDLPLHTQPDDIINAYAALGMTCTDATLMSIKKKRHENHVNFIAYFKGQDNIKLEQAAQLKIVNGARCSVARFSPNASGPTQCAKCLTFGHGKTNCNIFSRCVRCGGRHESAKCMHLIDKDNPKSKIPSDKVKCANCQGDHPANYKGCPSRKAYIDLQRQVREKAQPLRRRVVQQQRQVNYPSFMAPTPVANPASYAAVAATSAPKAQPHDMFSAAECITILNDLWSKLSVCTNKAEQIHAIGEYVINALAVSP